MESGGQILVAALVIILVVVSLFWNISRSRSILDDWAESEGVEILGREYRNVFRGPFFWTTAKGQTVYHVRVRYPDGRERTGWVRCGGWFLGLMSDHAEVRWDDADES